MTKDNYIYKSDRIEITILKPVYGTYVYLRDKYLNHARIKKIPIYVTIPDGVYKITKIGMWIKTGHMDKKVFLIPDQPMVLYGNHLAKYATKLINHDNDYKFTSDGMAIRV